jgi:hypothetical protein
MKTPAKKRPRDLNLWARSILADATEEDTPKEPDTRNPHAVALSKLGASKGGKARAKKLTPERRKEIAKKANEARWKKG